MFLLPETPDTDCDFAAFYERQAREGLVHSGLMNGHHFEIAADFKDEWASPVITWSAGGEEFYDLQGGDTIKVRSSGALTLAAGARYAYTASPETVFRSNMIAFPRWMIDDAKRNALEPGQLKSRTLETRLFLPDEETQRLMNDIAARCVNGYTDETWYAEQVALLYARLLEAQGRRSAAQDEIKAAKPATRAELARRIDRAQRHMLLNFPNSALGLEEVSREACLSPFHLIRVFKAFTGVTPMRRLAAIRMEAAMRLLTQTATSTKEVAEAVGYSDRTAFFKAFKAHFGCAPSQAMKH
jgi:AraC-like DNA-binding protein